MNSKHNFKVAAFVGIAILLAIPSASFGAVSISVGIAPPPLPVYAQPVAPGPDYIWTPGYWAYGPAGYYWVAGTWVFAPAPGLLWTPGYWGFANGVYAWNAGYWGPQVGFYGGVNYGFGYFGAGFVGGRWVGRHFDYNTAVMNVNRAVVHNTYVDRTVIRNTNNRVSFNGTGGVTARPTSAEIAAGRERRTAPTAVQTNHERNAGANRNNLQSVNNGRPATTATNRPAEQPANRPAVNRAESARPQSTGNREQARPPAAENRPAPVNRPQERPQARPPAAESRPAPVNRPQERPQARPAENRPAPVNARPQASHGLPPAPRAESRPAPINRPQPARPSVAANRPAPQHNAAPRQAPAGRPAERR
ncbi:MAG TPA: hypothetical protein VIY49_18300 [Bryobacteraceae bacterium]